MSNKLQPTAQSFVVCRDIFEDRHTGLALLVGPLRKLDLGGFPVTLPVSLFIQLTGGHGRYRLSVQLQDTTGATVGEFSLPREENLTDPLAYFQVYWRNLRFRFPQPGRYALVLMADGEEVGRHALEVALTLKG